MASQQLPLDLSYRASREAGDFIIGEANAEAAAWVDKWPDWPAAGLILLGGAATGKSHLASVWQQKAHASLHADGGALDTVSGNAVLDDADRWVHAHETGLFHAINRAKEGGTSLLLCARVPVDEWGLRLPDLLSRLKALPVARLSEPDDMLLASLFSRALAARGLIVRPEVADYLFPRLPRAAHEIAPFAEALDRFVLAEGRGMTLPVARAFLSRG